MVGWSVGWLVNYHKVAAKLLLSYYQNLKKISLKNIFYCKKLKYTIIYGLCHILIKTVRSPSFSAVDFMRLDLSVLKSAMLLRPSL